MAHGAASCPSPKECLVTLQRVEEVHSRGFCEGRERRGRRIHAKTDNVILVPRPTFETGGKESCSMFASNFRRVAAA